uniref:Uncharacterized protein n=1 Tax=Picea glauca TaxID=3330 RepID=A0A101LXK0_PICGL|nr:hypothetical protein ABT39_MTgene6196 [Picea glauca]
MLWNNWRLKKRFTCVPLSTRFFIAPIRVNSRVSNPLGLFMVLLEVSSGLPHVTNSSWVNHGEVTWLALGPVEKNWTVTLLGP